MNGEVKFFSFCEKSKKKWGGGGGGGREEGKM